MAFFELLIQLLIPDKRFSMASYSMMGGNRLSLTLTMFQNADSPIRLSAITAGGSQAVFFKVNTLGEESFLDDVKDLLEEILEE